MIGTTQEILENIEYIFDCANEKYFNNELEKPIFGLATTRNSYGHISVGNFWESEGRGKRELNINPEHLDRSLKEIVTTILHETAHLSNIMKGIKDCSGYYHNKEFKKEAERIGLEVSRNEKYGYAVTKPTIETEKFIEEYRIIGFNARRTTYKSIIIGKVDKKKKTSDKEGGEGKEKKTKKGNSIKYQCPVEGCKCIARTTKETKLICGEHYKVLLTEDI